jgi:hypothetical protein
MDVAESVTERADPTGDTSDIDVESILSEMGSDLATQAPDPIQGPTTAPLPATVPTPKEYTFDWNGKQIKAPEDKVIKWAQQGYDYSQKMQEFNKSKTDYEGQIGPYKMVDEYAKQNPEWWKHVLSQYEAREAEKTQGAEGQDASTEGVPDWLKTELNELKQFKTEYLSEKQAATQAKEDSTLTEEVQSIQKTYKDLDWKSANETGHTLEQQVLKHMTDKGIGNFKTAFRDYKHDQLLKLELERGKEMATKELQKRTKLGLLGETPTPTKGIRDAQAVKNKTYGDLLEEAKAELGIA